MQNANQYKELELVEIFFGNLSKEGSKDGGKDGGNDCIYGMPLEKDNSQAEYLL